MNVDKMKQLYLEKRAKELKWSLDYAKEIFYFKPMENHEEVLNENGKVCERLELDFHGYLIYEYNEFENVKRRVRYLKKYD